MAPESLPKVIYSGMLSDEVISEESKDPHHRSGNSEMEMRLLEENVNLKKLLSQYDAENHGSTSWQNSYNELTAMNTKIGVLEKELLKMHTLVNRLSYEVNMSSARLAKEREAKKHIEQYYKEKLNQYVAYFEAKHSNTDDTNTLEDILTIDDFLRLSEEKGLSEPNMESFETGQQRQSHHAHEEHVPFRDLAIQSDDQPKHDQPKQRSQRSQRRRSFSPSYRSLSIFRKSTKSAAEELSMHKEYEKNVRAHGVEVKTKKSTKNKNKQELKVEKQKLIASTTSLVIHKPVSNQPSAKLQATHTGGIGEHALRPEIKIPKNIVDSPPSLKQSHQTSDEDDGYNKASHRGLGGTRNCALNLPTFGTVFLHRDYTSENIGEGDHINDDLTSRYEKMGTWAAFYIKL